MKPVTEGRTAGPSIFRELFSSWSNAVLTLLCLGIAALALNAALSFALTGAAWSGSVEDCRAAPGACWPFIWAKLDQLLAGRYPEGERWRCLVAVLAPLAAIGAAFPLRERIGAGGVFLAAVGGIAIGFLALAGGIAGLAPVPAPQWGGLTLTLMIAYTGIAASLPLGILLALARRSSWPVPRYLAIIFIEFWRGVPLVAVLFMAAVMLPLFMRPGVDLEKLTRALIAVSLFAAAYVAEIVRGGLQSIPRSQFEAAEALGFSHVKALRLIILPQALRNALPGLIGTFIGLLKDTTLLLVIGLFDLLGMVQLAATDPDWSAPATALTGYVFAGVIFWLFCFGLSRIGAAIEQAVPGASRQ